MATITISLVISLQDGVVVSAAAVPGDRKLGTTERGATVTIGSVETQTNEINEEKTEELIGKPDAAALKDLAPAPAEAPVAKKVGSKDKDVPWFFKNINDIPAPMQEMLEKWSGLAPNDVRAHIHRVVCGPLRRMTLDLYSTNICNCSAIKLGMCGRTPVSECFSSSILASASYRLTLKS